MFYRLTRTIADSDFILDMAEFSLFTRRVRDVLCSAPMPALRARPSLLPASSECTGRSIIAYFR